MYIGKESGVVSAINQITSWKNYKFEKAKERKSERAIDRASKRFRLWLLTLRGGAIGPSSIELILSFD